MRRSARSIFFANGHREIPELCVFGAEVNHSTVNLFMEETPVATAQFAPIQPFDENYLRALGERDSGTESHFVSYFSQLLGARLRSRFYSPEQVNDVRQETFARVLAAVRSRNGIRRPECLRAFVSSVCDNVLHESYRVRTRYEALDNLPGEPVDKDKAVDPEAFTASQEVKQLVRKVLSRLPRKDQQVLRAIFLEERDKDEICRELGVTRDYLRVLLHRAKQQFLVRYQKAHGRSLRPKTAVA